MQHNISNQDIQNKRSYLYLDIGFYAACNLKCTYCRTDFVKDDKLFRYSNFIDQIEAFHRNFQAAVAKLSGYGEITMWKDLEPALTYLAELFPSVQIISNGTFSPKISNLLLKYSNVFPNITIDGHKMEMNTLRVQGNNKWHERMLENLNVFIKAERPTEINCVLHEYNADQFELYCDYIEKLDDGRGLIMLFPFPVKSFDRARDIAKSLRGTSFRRLAARIPTIWERFANILPARSYGQELQYVLHEGVRSKSCHVHWANLGSGSKNERLHCANYGEELSYGPMLESLTKRHKEISHDEKTHLQLGYVGSNCKSCYNHFHIINHYLDGNISLEELCRVPSLRPPLVANIAKNMKAQFIQSHYDLTTVISTL